MFLLKGVKQNLNEEKKHTILFDRNIYFYNNVIFPKMILKIQCDSHLKSVLELCCDLNASVKFFLCLFFFFSCHGKLVYKQGMNRGKNCPVLTRLGSDGEWAWQNPKRQEKFSENWLNFYHVPCGSRLQVRLIEKGQTGLPLKAKRLPPVSSIFSESSGAWSAVVET